MNLGASWKDIDINKPRCRETECERRETCAYYSTEVGDPYKKNAYRSRDHLFCGEYLEVVVF